MPVYICVSERTTAGIVAKWQQLDANITFLYLLLLLMKISERAIIYNIYMCNVYKDTQRGEW